MEFGAALRARYPDSRRCSYTVNNDPQSPEDISVRSMNFGQAWRTADTLDVEYRIELPMSFVRDGLAGLITDYVEDAREHPDPASSLDRALESAGWPGVPTILETAALLSRFVDLFGYDLILRWFGDGEPPHGPGFVLNTIDNIDLATSSEVVTFKGKARETGGPVPYQDR